MASGPPSAKVTGLFAASVHVPAVVIGPLRVITVPGTSVNVQAKFWHAGLSLMSVIRASAAASSSVMIGINNRLAATSVLPIVTVGGNEGVAEPPTPA